MYPLTEEEKRNQSLMNPVADALANPVQQPPAYQPPVMAPLAPPAPMPKTEFMPAERTGQTTSSTSTVSSPAYNNTSSSTTSKVLPPSFYQAQKGVDTATSAEATAAQKLGDIEAKQAQKELEATQQNTIAMQARAEQQKLRDEAYAKEAQKELEAINKKFDEYSNKKYEGFWTNKTVGTKIISALAVAAGAYGAALSGTNKNYALEIIQKEMDDDFRNFKENKDNQIQAIQNSKISFEQKQKLISQAKADTAAYYMAQNDIAANKIRELGLSFKGEKAKATVDLTIAGLQKAGALKQQEYMAGLASTITNNLEQRAAQSQTTTQTQTQTTKKDLPVQRDATGKIVKPLGKDEQSLMDKYESDQQTKDYRAVRTAYEKVKTAGTAKNPTGADDMALIYGFMKILDPGSMVKDTEYNMAQSSGSYGEQAKAFLSKYTTGEKLTPELRSYFVKTAKDITQAQAIGHEQTRNDYRESAKQRGLDYKTMFPAKDPILQQQQSSSFPIKVRKGKLEATVSNDQELQDAQSQGWN